MTLFDLYDLKFSFQLLFINQEEFTQSSCESKVSISQRLFIHTHKFIKKMKKIMNVMCLTTIDILICTNSIGVLLITSMAAGMHEYSCPMFYVDVITHACDKFNGSTGVRAWMDNYIPPFMMLLIIHALKQFWFSKSFLVKDAPVDIAPTRCLQGSFCICTQPMGYYVT